MNEFNNTAIQRLVRLYYWMEKVKKSIMAGEKCFMEANFALEYSHSLDMLKEHFPEEAEKCDWLELSKRARKDAEAMLEVDDE